MKIERVLSGRYLSHVGAGHNDGSFKARWLEVATGKDASIEVDETEDDLIAVHVWSQRRSDARRPPIVLRLTRTDAAVLAAALTKALRGEDVETVQDPS